MSLLIGERLIQTMDIRKIIAVHELIKAQRAGDAKKLSSRLGVSERTVYTYIRFLKKELKAPIKYNALKQTYTFEDNGHLNFEWQK